MALLRGGAKLRPYEFRDLSVCGRYRGPVVPREQIERVTCPWCRTLVAMNDSHLKRKMEWEMDQPTGDGPESQVLTKKKPRIKQFVRFHRFLRRR